MLIKQRSPSLPRNLALWTFSESSVVFTAQVNLPPQFSGPEVLCTASDKAKLFAENFSKNSNLDDSDISLPVLPCRTSMKLHNISVTPKKVNEP